MGQSRGECARDWEKNRWRSGIGRFRTEVLGRNLVLMELGLIPERVRASPVRKVGSKNDADVAVCTPG
jgi:hypothetical protein